MFRIEALPRETFAFLFGKDDETLRQSGAVRRLVDESPGFPCRISLKDLAVGDTALLVNFEHMRRPTPYRARHAIFVSETEPQAHPEIGEVPDVIARRLISLRAFDMDGMMLTADLAEGRDVANVLENLFTAGAVSFVDLHNAKQGCFAARAVRA